MTRRESPKPEISLLMVTRGARVDLWMSGAAVALALSGCSSAPVEAGTAVVDGVGTDLRDFTLAEGGEGGAGGEGGEGGATTEGGGEGGEGGEGAGEGGEGGASTTGSGEGGEGGGEGGEGGASTGGSGEGGEGGGEGGEGGATIKVGAVSIFVPGALYPARRVT